MSSGEDTLVGRTLRDGVQVRERLKETPLGALYRAEDASGHEVAVLVLRAATTDSVTIAQLRNRFCRAMEIRHPNVAAVLAVGETPEGLTYAVAECLSGELLSAVLARRGALSAAESLDIALQSAAGLQAAHDVRWVHGNLSPDTILLSQTPGGYPIIKLIGFTQQLLIQDEARPIDPAPLAEYASPERTAGQTLDQRSDVFSLAAVLFALLTGAPPTTSATDYRIPASIQAALNRALYPIPSGRFRTIAEFAAALSATEDVPGVVSLSTTHRTRAVEYRSAAALVAIAAGLWLLGNGHKPTASVPDGAAAGESGAVPVAGVRPTPPFARRQPPQAREAIRHDSAAARVSRSSPVRRPDSAATRSSTPGPRVSPFSRAHPWVAVPGKPFYYRSTCPEALQSRDLIYFESEAQASAAGFKPTETPECR